MRLVIASSVYRIVVGETNSALVSPLMQNARVQVPPDAETRMYNVSQDSCILVYFPFYLCSLLSANLLPGWRLLWRSAVAPDPPSYLFIQKVSSGASTHAGFINSVHLHDRSLLRRNASSPRAGIIKSPWSSSSTSSSERWQPRRVYNIHELLKASSARERLDLI